ncbi:hypothetical protein EYF80_009979 [Liparis tanakae]|uniref:Uncharacterized protein n=1 Tax=Liparis tanakae TaxID=230148 RepID=A0A4Z2IPF3_9TELE|nr:hypothetical protein EYF80_009979 [Liparis tanakae]
MAIGGGRGTASAPSSPSSSPQLCMPDEEDLERVPLLSPSLRIRWRKRGGEQWLVTTKTVSLDVMKGPVHHCRSSALTSSRVSSCGVAALSSESFCEPTTDMSMFFLVPSRFFLCLWASFLTWPSALPELSRRTGLVSHFLKAPVRLIVESLQNLHSLASPHRQLSTAATVAGHEVVDHHRQLTATGELKWKIRFSSAHQRHLKEEQVSFATLPDQSLGIPNLEGLLKYQLSLGVDVPIEP